MLSTITLQSGFGFLASPLGVLAVLILLAVILFVGRFIMEMAWKLVVIGIIVVGTLYILSLLGFGLI
jgi:hypothetical protein